MKYLENIKAIRKAKGITQQEMSERIGMAKNNYGKVENGQIELTIGRLYQIADILGVSIITLLGESIADVNQLTDLQKTNIELANKNEELQTDLSRTKEMFDAVWPFAKEILTIFKKVNWKSVAENKDKETLLKTLKEKGFEIKDDSLSGLKLD